MGEMISIVVHGLAPRGAAQVPLRHLITLEETLALVCAGYVALQFAAKPAQPVVVIGDGVTKPKSMAWVPGGEFLMGSDHKLAQRNERPAQKVRVGDFWMDRTHVTNAQFAVFVKTTGYVTTAERKPDWEAIRAQVPPGTPEAARARARARRDGIS